MKRIILVIELMVLSLTSFAQFEIDYEDWNRNQKELSKSIRSEIEAQIRQQQAQQQRAQQQQAQIAKQQAVQDFNNRISDEGQQRMEYNNNPDYYIDRSITNRNASSIISNDRYNRQNQTRDLRTEPVHSDNLNSKSLQMLREANRAYFSNEDKDVTINPNASVPLFEAPKLGDDYPISNADLGTVQQYFDNSKPLTDAFLGNPVGLEKLLEASFDSVSGFNIDEIKSKQPEDRTPEEQQALANYLVYRVKEMERMNLDIELAIDNSEEKKEIDAAILALDSYGDDTEGWLNKTNFKKMDLEELSVNDYGSILKVAEEIKKCNDTQSETGFHAELYYNEVTDTYVISFRGTESDDENDVETDKRIARNAVIERFGENAEYEEIKQYEMALQIAKVINEIPKEERGNLNIEVVGHSLGGGLASIVGLEACIDAKTFNASMVPNVFLKEKGLYDKVQNGDIQNISAYHTSTDLLSITQKIGNASAIGTSINIGNPAAVTETVKAIGTGVTSEAGKVSLVAGAAYGVMAAGHKMKPMVRDFYDRNNEKKKPEWDIYRNAQCRLQMELQSAEIRQGF